MGEELCKSCEHPISGNFCANCGEKLPTNRLTAKDITGDFASNLLELEYPLLRTLRGLTLRPGAVCREYVGGTRKPYYKPFQYYLLTIAVFYLFFYASGLQISDYYKVASPNFSFEGNSEQIKKLSDQIMDFMTQYIRIVQFWTIPILSFYSWILFKRTGYNLTENFVMNLYLTAHASLIGLVLIPLSFIEFSLYFGAMATVGFAYQIWGFKQFYQVSLSRAILKGILAMVFMMITISLLQMIILMFALRYFGNNGLI